MYLHNIDASKFYDMWRVTSMMKNVDPDFVREFYMSLCGVRVSEAQRMVSGMAMKHSDLTTP